LFAFFITKTQKNGYLHLLYLPFVYFIMLPPKFTLKDTRKVGAATRRARGVILRRKRKDT
jgi:hypothetical protein